VREVNYLVVHCSATSFGKDLDVMDIDRMHRRRGWSGVGYNYVIKLDGTIENGRPLEKIPAHVKGFNRNSIGICYIGGLDESGKGADTRTPQQKEALLFQLMSLKQRFPDAVIVWGFTDEPASEIVIIAGIGSGLLFLKDKHVGLGERD